MLDRLRFWRRRYVATPRRYRNLFRIVHQRRCRTLLEVGTWNGEHARQLIETAGLHWPRADVQYYGFDLFEDLTDADLEREFSKRPPHQDTVHATLVATGARVRLAKGYSRETLPRFVQDAARPRHLDFVLIDGGHAIDTIASDWNAVRSLLGPQSVVVFDDYYDNNDAAVRELGCRSLIEGLDRREYDVQVLGPADRFRKDWGVLRVRMVSVRPLN